jgi:hypothetical protein
MASPGPPGMPMDSQVRSDSESVGGAGVRDVATEPAFFPASSDAIELN